MHRARAVAGVELAHRTPEHGEPGRRAHALDLTLEPVRHRHVVGIESCDVSPSSLVEPEVQASRESLALLGPENDEPRIRDAREQVRRPVLRAVVHDDELEVRERLAEDARDSRAEEAISVVRRENDRDERGLGSLHGAGWRGGRR